MNARVPKGQTRTTISGTEAKGGTFEPGIKAVHQGVITPQDPAKLQETLAELVNQLDGVAANGREDGRSDAWADGVEHAATLLHRKKSGGDLQPALADLIAMLDDAAEQGRKAGRPEAWVAGMEEAANFLHRRL